MFCYYGRSITLSQLVICFGEAKAPLEKIVLSFIIVSFKAFKKKDSDTMIMLIVH